MKARRGAARRGGGQTPGMDGMSLVQLAVCLAILGAVLILKAVNPDGTRDFLKKHVADGWDYTQVLVGVGQSLHAFFTDVPRPEDMPVSGGQSPSASPPAQPSEVAGEETITAPPSGMTPEEETDPINEPGEDEAALSGIGGFGEPVVWLREDLLPVDPELDIDDTLPLPFGFEKPERADYTVYELPFETTMPAEGRFTSGYGYRVHPILNKWLFHYGVDIANPSGTPVYSFADGKVSAVGENDSYGKYIIIEHADGFATVYAHCSKILVKTGKSVRMGDKIAQMGATGMATGPHLHFEIRKGDMILNPEYYLDLGEEPK